MAKGFVIPDLLLYLRTFVVIVAIILAFSLCLSFCFRLLRSNPVQRACLQLLYSYPRNDALGLLISDYCARAIRAYVPNIKMVPLPSDEVHTIEGLIVQGQVYFTTHMKRYLVDPLLVAEI